MNKKIIDCKTITQEDIDKIKNLNDRDIMQESINMIQNNDINKKALFLELTIEKNCSFKSIFVRDLETGKYIIIDNRANCIRFSNNKYSKNKIDLNDFLEDTKFFN